MMSRYERKLEKMERGNWFRKSLVVMGILILGIVLEQLLGALGNALGLSALESVKEALSAVIFMVYLFLTLALYTITGVWGYVLHLSKEAFLLPWRFTPVIVFAWMFFMFELAIGLMLLVAVEVIVLFCPPLLLHLARNYYEDRSGVMIA